MNSSTMKHYLIGTAITLLVLILSRVGPDLFDSTDRAMLRQWYHLRGEHQVDSSIVILYFGNDDIDALGGLPLKRNYYALVVSALHDAGAKAIGIDIAFTEPDKEHPEYDAVLAGVVKTAGNVVLGGYFSSLNASMASPSQAQVAPYAYRHPAANSFPSGENLELPYPDLLENCSVLGHTNIGYNLHVPLFIRSQQGDVPAFPLEVLRAGLSSSKEDIKIDGHSVSFSITGKTLSIPFDDKGEIAINYTGGISSLRMISALRFLREYDEWKSTPGAQAITHPLYNKIVLVGIIAPGSSMFVQTPFEHQFPSIGLHAMMMDNILNGTLLKFIPVPLEFLIALVIGLFVTFLMTIKRQTLALLSVLGSLIALAVLSYILFSSASYVLPITKGLSSAILVTVGLLYFRHSLVQTKLTVIEGEKERSEEILREKEARLTVLEQQLQIKRQSEEVHPSAELLSEIRNYEKEIAALKAQVEDFKPGTPAGTAPLPGMNQFQGIVYSATSPLAEVVSFIKKIAVTDASVLILGDSGTGKELAARAIHQSSKRSARQFIPVNCGALTETLLESELFGHEKGAFTGAVKEKAGRFELADEGTIFLDEIAETSEAFQVKLLRVLQEGTFERVGGTETRKVNVRVLAATNRDIKQEVGSKRFREDLYYRLNVFTVLLPPLRERKDDIILLVQQFLKSENPELTVSASVMNIFQQHEWKGNVRELQSVLKHAVVLAQADGRILIRQKDLPKDFSLSASDGSDIEEQILESLRDKQFGRSAISETAEELGGLNRGTVAEYFRGYCFKVFCESAWNFDMAINRIAGTQDPVIRDKVQKKLEEYLSNAVELIDKEKSLETILISSRSKSKNLPLRYHTYFESLIRARVEGSWSEPT